jgi:branched-chain amino acid transport system permease protein
MGLLLGLVVLFMPDGIIPAVTNLVERFRPQKTSIREVSQAELAEQRRTTPGPGAGQADQQADQQADTAVTEGARS